MKYYFFSLILFVSFTIKAQEFKVTPEGLKDKENLENSYLVIEAPDKSAKELYDDALKYINEKYKNPSEVIKGQTENDYLRFITHSPQFMVVNNSGADLTVSADYTTELRFKDGKVRYELSELKMTADNGGRPVMFQGSIWSGFPIYKKNGELIREDAKTTIENFFNGQVASLSSTLLDKPTEADNW